MKIIPVTFRQACAFVKEHHRHNKPPVGHKFSIGAADDNGLTLEVNRTCTDGTDNANSMLYGAVWRAAKAMGYTRCITYTQHDETGASLRAVGWRRVKDLPANKGWSVPSRQRDDIGSAGIARVLWEISR